MKKIIVKGARENNLKNINLELPKNKLIVMTGVSGSGKSSLAFNTIYAEGQRRYVESLSAYARQFLGNVDKPDVDSIEGLSPAISIDQKTTNKNPRSTVGTVTEIYDYLRLLYARVGTPHCPTHGNKIQKQSIEEMVDQVLKIEKGKKIQILAPLIQQQKGSHSDIINKMEKEGFVKVRVNNEFFDIDEIEIDEHKKNTIEIVIDRMILKEDSRSRIHESVELATRVGKGKVIIYTTDIEFLMSENFACPLCDFSLEELEPRMFSFNSPFGACDKCNGLGFKLKIDENLIIPDKNKSIKNGAIVPFANMNKKNINIKKLNIVCDEYNINMNKKVKDLTKKELKTILYGTDEKIKFNIQTRSGNSLNSNTKYEGIINNLERRYVETNSQYIRDWIGKFMSQGVCDKCHGKRLKESVLSVYINKKNIIDITDMSVSKALEFFKNIKLNKTEKEIANLVIKEINERLSFLENVGLNYLSLSRDAGSLSGGELQRIRLATQIGSKLSGILYVLDEPSIGLHQRDNEKLLKSLKEMRDLDNTLIVVEHDIDTIKQADHVVDIGPAAGNNGGEIIYSGEYEGLKNASKSLTADYINNKKRIDIPGERRKGNRKNLIVKGATHNNLKNIDVKFPLGKFICVTGVSGSGKSTLVNEILYKGISLNLYNTKVKAGVHKKITGLKNIDKVIEISQDPIGRTPRSNPATYVGVFDDIRDLYANTKEAKIRGYKKGRFSFNVKGGRCEVCRGDGLKKIEMHFLPDVYVPCEVCHGKRYNRETLDIKYKGKSIADVLDMRVDEALEFFENISKIKRKLKILHEVGLGYIKLGQNATTLSGGEASRIKLSKELQKRSTGKTLFILDEPTTGLHIDDIKKLLIILNRIVDNGDTVIVIEHNLDVIKVADHIIDLGPEGGEFGGDILFEGTPEKIIENENSYTGKYLKDIIKK